MRKYFIIGTIVTFILIFNLGYVFHELVAGDFFRKEIGAIQRDHYNIPVIAIAFLIYVFLQAWFLDIFYSYALSRYKWSLAKTAIIFGAIIGFLWDGLQGGMIEVATFKMPAIVFWVDSGYHTTEGILTAIILSFFYRKFVLTRQYPNLKSTISI